MNLNLSRATLSFGVIAFVLAGCGTPQSLLEPSRGAGQNVAPRVGNDVDPSIKPCPTSSCIYLTNVWNSGTSTVTVYPSDATGNVFPYRTISGVEDPTGIALDASGQIYVSNYHQYGLAIYAASANGNAKPTRRIRGRKTGLFDTYGIALDSIQQIYALGNFGVVHVYAASAHGDATPIRTLVNRDLRPEDAGIALDSAGKIYVTRNQTISGSGEGEVLVYAAGAHGHASPIWKIYGSKTMLSQEPGGVAVDGAGNVYVADSEADQVDVYAAGKHGNVAPVQAIAGASTGLLLPTGIAIDAVHNIYVANESGITVYAAGATGDTAPIQTIAGSQTGIASPSGIAVH